MYKYQGSFIYVNNLLERKFFQQKCTPVNIMNAVLPFTIINNGKKVSSVNYDVSAPRGFTVANG